MSITLAQKLGAFPAGGWTVPIPPAVFEALHSQPGKAGSDALALYVWVHQNPKGWSFGNRDQEAAKLGWKVGRYRQAVRALCRAGLYLWRRIRDAAGRWRVESEFLALPDAEAASSHVGPEAVLPEAGETARIPSPERVERERVVRAKRTPGLHLPETCQRQAAGLDCGTCGKVRQEREKAAKTTTVPNSPAYRRFTRDPARGSAPVGGWRTLLQ